MTDAQLTACADTDEAEDTNTSSNPSLHDVIEAGLSRRQVLSGSAGAAALTMLGGLNPSPAAATDARANQFFRNRRPRLGFVPVAKSLEDAVVLPARYSHDVLYALGDPIARTVSDYNNDGTDAAASFALRAGDHHDGIEYFGLGRNGRRDPHSCDRGLLCMNHEAITPAFIHPTGQTIVNNARTVADEVIREFFVHGVSVIEVAREKDRKRKRHAWSAAYNLFHRRRPTDWDYEQGSRFNRRIHTLTEFVLSGPAARTSYMVTRFSPDGSRTRGTVNNCAAGATPWGTYLTCEENWAGYFRRITASDNPNRTARELTSLARYGIAGNGRELWATVTPDTADNLFGRWNAMKLGTSADGSDDYRNAPNTYGWVSEIDPYRPHAVPKKRTALGRFAHEGAVFGAVIPGQPLAWYMGDDGRNEYIFKYVSNKPWDPRDAGRGLTAGDKYLDDGKLYVAQFLPDGGGQWLELKFGINNITADNSVYPFAEQADVLVNARLAADAAGATKMDRPEWGAVHPKNYEVYFTLTNTNAASRPINRVDGANPRFYNDRTTTGTDQRGNPNGHIVRFAEDGGYNDALSFTWDIYLFGARATADAGNVNLSGLTDANDFSSPDGLWFSYANPGLLWIETDDGAYTDVTNCMLLAAIPGSVGDGAETTFTNVDGATTQDVTTFVGKQPGEGRLRRFLVGPKECEITGITETPDGKTLFINIQHPGENTAPNFATGAFGSHWPGGGLTRPRSATIVITRDDGGEVGIE